MALLILKLRHRTKSVLPCLILLVLFYSTSTHASTFSCSSFGDVTQEQALKYKAHLTDSLRANAAPAGLRKHPDGSVIPIVLVSKNTFKNPVVEELLQNTVAFGMNIQWATKADTGATICPVILNGIQIISRLRSTKP